MEWLRRRLKRETVLVSSDLLAEALRDLPATVSPGTPEAVVLESVLCGGFAASEMAAIGLPFVKAAFQRSSATERKAFGAVCSLAVLARWLGLPEMDPARRGGGVLALMPDAQWVSALIGVLGGISDNDFERYVQLMSVARENLSAGGQHYRGRFHPVDQVFLADSLAVLEKKPLPALPSEFLRLKSLQSLMESGFPISTWDAVDQYAFWSALTRGTRLSFRHWTQRAAELQRGWSAAGLIDSSHLGELNGES